MNIPDFHLFKRESRKITMVTCYDFWSARLLKDTSIDALLVGDSAAMVMHGFPTTLQADIPMMESHTRAVVRGAGEKCVIADMPFPGFSGDFSSTMNGIESLMRAGAKAVKVEGVRGIEETIRHVVHSGIPVMGHLGLTPQSVHAFGGYQVQGRRDEERIIQDAQQLEALGCFALVLECVPERLAQKITERVGIATIGIGAGKYTDGQVLVLQDLLGFTDTPMPIFVRTFVEGKRQVQEALEQFAHHTRLGTFPNEKESYR